MGWTVKIFNIGIISRMLIFVFNHKTNRSSGCNPVKDPGLNFHLVRLLPGSGDMGLTGFSAVKVGLDKGYINFKTCRTAINDSADRNTMRLTIGCECKYSSETVQNDRF